MWQKFYITAVNFELISTFVDILNVTITETHCTSTWSVKNICRYLFHFNTLNQKGATSVLPVLCCGPGLTLLGRVKPMVWLLLCNFIMDFTKFGQSIYLVVGPPDGFEVKV